MKLTYEQITSAVNGIVRTEQTKSGLELHRFAKEQEDFFYKSHPAFCNDSFFDGYFGRNCRTCAGVTLDFISDAKTFEIKFGGMEYAKSSVERIHLFDLYVDNEMVSTYKTTDEMVYKASGEKQRFTLVFPTFAFPIISSVELKDATVFIPQKKQADVLFLGDSITHGAFAVNPSNSYVMRVARKMGIGILNQGNSGFVYDKGSISKVCDPKIVVTAYGTNDFMRKSAEQIKTETEDFLIKLKALYKDSKIVSILPLWSAHDGKDKNYKFAERNCLKIVYERYSDCIIDGFSLVPHDQKYFVDSVHPNDDGFAFYGENLAKALESIISCNI